MSDSWPGCYGLLGRGVGIQGSSGVRKPPLLTTVIHHWVLVQTQRWCWINICWVNKWLIVLIMKFVLKPVSPANIAGSFAEPVSFGLSLVYSEFVFLFPLHLQWKGTPFLPWERQTAMQTWKTATSVWAIEEASQLATQQDNSATYRALGTSLWRLFPDLFQPQVVRQSHTLGSQSVPLSSLLPLLYPWGRGSVGYNNPQVAWLRWRMSQMSQGGSL